MKSKILILGGTEFVGRQLVEKLLDDSSVEVFLFNRGKTNPDLFPNVKLIVGDRNTDDVKKLQDYKWDYIIDFSSYYPNSLENTLKFVNKDVKSYIYVSTISLYSLKDIDPNLNIEEDFPKVDYTNEDKIDTSSKTYGKRKKACEDVLNEADWLNKLILRPSIIYGKYDPTDRLYYWLKNIKDNEEIEIPDNGDHQLSLTFADDFVEVLHSALKGQLKNDTYNCSTHDPLSVGKMFEVMRTALQTDCTFNYVTNKALIEKGKKVPLSFGKNLLISHSKLMANGHFKFKSFQESIESMVAYYNSVGWKDCKIKFD